MALSNKGNFIISTTSSPASGTEYKPKSLKIDFQSLASEESGRSDSGVMNIIWILKKIRKIEIEMPPVSYSNMSTIQNLLSSVQGKTYWITYFDTLDGAEKTIQVYTSESSSECYSGIILNGVWKGVSFNAIQIGGEN